MITVNVDTSTVIKFLGNYEKETNRSLETAIDKTAFDIRDAIVTEMKSVFDNPTPYTLNSLKVTKTRNHNMQASVWFKDPERMEDHYLAPQVEGTERKLKGFERGIDGKNLIPGHALKVNRFGNIQHTQAKKILGDYKAGGKTTNKDYVYLPSGSNRKNLPPGIYQRFAYRGSGLSSSAKKSLGVSGTHQKGMKRGRISSIIRARGLRPILLVGKDQPVKPLLKFYEVAKRVFGKQFEPHFLADLKKRLP